MDFYKNFDQLGIPVVYTISGTQYSVITDLVAEPVDIPTFKEHARIDFDTDDALIAMYVKAARIHLEKYAQLSFGVKTMKLTARCIPDNYRLMFGPVNVITDPVTGYANVGDIIKPGGEDISIEYSTLATYFTDDTVKTAICRYALGLYVQRENILDTKFSPASLIDEAEKMLDTIKNVIWF